LQDLLGLGGKFTGEGFLEDGLFQFSEVCELLAVDGFEAVGFSREGIKLCDAVFAVTGENDDRTPRLVRAGCGMRNPSGQRDCCA